MTAPDEDLMRVYLDAAASTPLDPAVLTAMTETLLHVHANPASAHWAGREAQHLVQAAREQVGALVGRSAGAVTFTSGATEANNLVLRGLQSPLRRGPDRRGVVTTRAEHPSVLRTMEDLAARGAPVQVLEVDAGGRVDLAELREVVGEDTLLVSVMAANNETGALADLAAIAGIAHDAGALLHTDATQLLAWGALEPSVFETDPLTGSPMQSLMPGLDPLDLDLITISAHKMHGPQGVGALVASGDARSRLAAVTSGGGQENGLRSGTLNVAGIVGFGTAADLARSHGPTARADTAGLRDRMHQQLLDALTPILTSTDGVAFPQLNGPRHERLPGILNLALGDAGHGLDAEEILARTPALAASTGSACHTGMPEPSPVLLAMGHSVARAQSSIRLSLSRLTTAAEVTIAVSLLTASVTAYLTDAAAHDTPHMTPETPHRKLVTP